MLLAAYPSQASVPGTTGTSVLAELGSPTKKSYPAAAVMEAAAWSSCFTSVRPPVSIVDPFHQCPVRNVNVPGALLPATPTELNVPFTPRLPPICGAFGSQGPLELSYASM